MRWNRAQEAASGLNEVNLTPLIDVSLVLVVILLLATPLAFESAFGLRRAEASARSAATEKDLARVELDIVSDDEVRVNHRAVPVAELETTLPPLLKEGSPQVTVTCADAVTHGAFVRVLDVTKSCGAADIAVIGR